MPAGTISPLYAARRWRNKIWMSLSVVAAAIGLIGLFMISLCCSGRGFPVFRSPSSRR